MSVPLLLVAHGSRDRRAAAVTGALVDRIATARPDVPVAAGYLEHAGPRPGTVIADWALLGVRRVVVAPLLLTDAYHAGIDLPAVLHSVESCLPSVSIDALPVLGGEVAVAEALDDRLTAAGMSDVDGLILGAAGTRDVRARGVVERTAAAVAVQRRIGCVAAYAAGGGRDVPRAVQALRSAGACRIGVLSYFLAPGRLHDRIIRAAARSGVSRATEPFGATASLARLVLRRYDIACPSGPMAGAAAGRPSPVAG